MCVFVWWFIRRLCVVSSVTKYASLINGDKATFYVLLKEEERKRAKTRSEQNDFAINVRTPG